VSSPQNHPPISFDKASILAALDALKRRDRLRRLFGAASHDYALNPPLSEAEVAAFERKHHIALPDDYRYFLTQVGNGGAGPSHGVLPLGEWAFTDKLHKIDDPEWHIDGEPGKPFQHTRAWNLPESIRALEPDPDAALSFEEEGRQMEEWDKVRQAAYAHVMDGAVPICERGCGLLQWLVVNGPQRGFIWDDNLADDAGIEPHFDSSGRPLTFADWYLAWLDAAKTQPLPLLPSPPRRRTVQHFFPDWAYGVTFAVGMSAGLFLAIALRVGFGPLALSLSSGFAIALLLLVAWLDRRLLAGKQQPTGAGQTPNTAASD
jgi:hypothetical protein